jgi:PAS domain S-box-containing protein
MLNLSDALLAAIVESSDDAIASKDLAGIVTSWNRAAERLFGYSAAEMIGNPIAVLEPPIRVGEMREILERIRRGERIDHFDTVRRRKDGSLIEISLTVSPIRDETGRIVGASKVARDISERKAAERQQRLLVAELDHRVRNTLAVVSSIARHTLRPGLDPVAARQSFLDRLHALAATHSLLSQARWKTVALREVVLAQLEPYRDRVHVAGGKVALVPRLALIFGMTLHELATNAAKHGALSNAEGEVEITWEVAGLDNMLHLTWRERGGPLVTAASRQGFGRMLIERSFSQEQNGEARLDLHPEGLVCHLRVPVEAQSILD